MDYQILILQLLLDKYEDSRHFFGDARINRGISLKFNKKEFPRYDLENTEVKDAVHYAVGQLREKGVINLKWMRFEEENILEKVSLNLKKLDLAYQLAARKPKENSLNDVLRRLIEMKRTVQTIWINSFLDDSIFEIENHKALPKYLPKEEELCYLFLSALEAIEEKGTDEMLERVFSRKYLGGSKELERKVRSRLVTVIKKYFPLDQELEDEEVLENMGLIKTSEELLFQGPLKINFFRETIDFSPFVFGASMNTEMIKRFEIRKLDVDRIITIENKASYLEYIKSKDVGRELTVYLGGFYSPVKKIFLEKIQKYLQEQRLEPELFHWGDIDLGGFNIFLQVKKVVPKVLPFMMDEKTLGKYANYGDEMSRAYEKKLESLLKKSEFSLFHDLIKGMLSMGLKLEQEAIHAE